MAEYLDFFDRMSGAELTLSELELPKSEPHMRFAGTDAVPFAAAVLGWPRPKFTPVVRLAPPQWFSRAFGGMSVIHGAFSVSVYAEHILLNARNADLDLLFPQSVLVHETTHWLQLEHWGVEKFVETPVAERELGAYRVQMAYVAFHGMEPAKLAPHTLDAGNVRDQTKTDLLYRDGAAWLEPWRRLGALRRAGGFGVVDRLASRGRGRAPVRAALRVVGGGTLRTVALTEPLNDTLPKAEKYLLREKDRWERSEQYIGRQLRMEIDYE